NRRTAKQSGDSQSARWVPEKRSRLENLQALIIILSNRTVFLQPLSLLRLSIWNYERIQVDLRLYCKISVSSRYGTNSSLSFLGSVIERRIGQPLLNLDILRLCETPLSPYCVRHSIDQNLFKNSLRLIVFVHPINQSLILAQVLAG